MSDVRRLLTNVRNALSDSETLSRYLQWRATSLVGKEARLEFEGVSMSGFPSFNAFIATWRYRPDAAEISFLRCAATNADTVFDVGANFGVFSLLVARHAVNARLFSFEPNPRTFDSLERNLILNGIANTTVINSAVGAYVGEVGMTDGEPATNRIADVNEGKFQVPITTLDAFTGAYELSQIDLLKIDVEGAEVDVLDGATGLLSRGAIKLGYIEICPQNLKAFGVTALDLYERLAHSGYQLYFLENPNRALARSDIAALPERFLANAIFRRPICPTDKGAESST